MSIYELLRTRWLEAGIAADEVATQGSLERFEAKHRISLPSPFKEYLLTVNGMKDGQTDENLVSFLSLETIDQEANFKEISADQVEIAIAEFCIYSHVYVIRIARNGDQTDDFATDGQHEKRIASSFEEFVSQYLSSPAEVAYCWV